MFLGEDSFFGDMPDLITKSFSGTKHIKTGADIRAEFIDLTENQICFVSIKDHSISDIFDNLNFLKEKLLFLVGGRDSFKSFEDLYEKHKLQLAGFIDIESSPSIYLSLVNNAYKYLGLKIKMGEFVDLGKDLNELATKTIEETNKLKDLHQDLVPIRKVNTKGLDIYSKFSAGTAAGGEFFDYSIQEGIVSLVLISTSSYIVTSYYLTYVSMIKGNTNEKDLETFINTVNSEIKNLGISENDSSLLYINIDTKKMMVDGYNFGAHQVRSSSDFAITGNSYPVDFNFAEKARFSHQLSRGEKLYLMSKGMELNANRASISLDDIIKPGSESEIEEEFNEAFFQLKKTSSTKFLEFDATMVLLKVDENAIFSL